MGRYWYPAVEYDTETVFLTKKQKESCQGCKHYDPVEDACKLFGFKKPWRCPLYG